MNLGRVELGRGAVAAILSVLAVAACPGLASATIVTDFFFITASDFGVNSYSSITPPVDPVVGNFAISFDDADVTDATPISVTVFSLNVPYTAPISAYFQSAPVDAILFSSYGTFTTPQLPFFQMAVNFPALIGGGYAAFSYAPGDGAEFETQNVTITPYTVGTPTGVPEPATWATLLIGTFGVGAYARRRRSALRPSNA